MPISRDLVLNKGIHKNASKQILLETSEFATSLIHQSKILAAIDKSDEVQTRHIQSSVQLLYSKDKPSWRKELSKLFGGALFGAFVPGFINALNSANTSFIVLYTASGFVGLLLMVLATRK
jgi:hypothetical protein